MKHARGGNYYFLLDEEEVEDGEDDVDELEDVVDEDVDEDVLDDVESDEEVLLFLQKRSDVASPVAVKHATS